jgi:hypothetical protein
MGQEKVVVSLDWWAEREDRHLTTVLFVNIARGRAEASPVIRASSTLAGVVFGDIPAVHVDLRALDVRR